jgi:tRNA 5-methylaminomethyl-2-thiouridine biosynthesis bifunctional protein
MTTPPNTTNLFTPATIAWQACVPHATQFADTYYKPANSCGTPWDESCHNFLSGNNLAQRFANPNLKHFTVAETGFGTGLNLLTVWDLWQKTAPKNAHLDFVSVDVHPLLPQDLAKALEPFERQVPQNIATLKSAYPPLIPGWHRRHLAPNVTLTLIFTDVLEAYTQLHAQVDAWFLDGFSPSRNMAMWQQDVFNIMAKLSHNQTTFGTFTAASFVRQGLQQAGFEVQKRQGFGRKHHCLQGIFAQGQQRQIFTPQVVTIAGAGLAGAATAYALQRRGVATQVFDTALGFGAGASGNASSNEWGLVNPKIQALPSVQTSLGSAAYSFAPHILQQLGLWHPQPSLYLANDPTEQQRQQKLLQLGWHVSHMQAHPQGLLFPHAGITQPKKLVPALCANTTIKWQTSAPKDANIFVEATGQGLLNQQWPLQPVRGQVTYGVADKTLAQTTMFGNYAMPLPDGGVSVGATFARGRTDSALCPEDTITNINAAKQTLGLEITPTHAWAGVRVAAKDYLPIAGQITHNHYVLGALGSHGIQYALILGELLAAQIVGAPWPLPKNVVAKLHPQRFKK